MHGTDGADGVGLRAEVWRRPIPHEGQQEEEGEIWELQLRRDAELYGEAGMRNKSRSEGRLSKLWPLLHQCRGASDEKLDLDSRGEKL